MIKILYFIYQLFIGLPIFLVSTFLICTIIIIGCSIGDAHFWSYWPGKIWSYITCYSLLLPVNVKRNPNVKKDTSYVFVANHQGAFDIWTIYGYLNHNFKWLMKIGLKKIFMVGWACDIAGHVFVDDSNLHGIKQTISDAEKRLKNGMSLLIFPEGSRSWDGKMIPFKRGAFMLASEFKLPVVPITIDGSFKAMPRTTYNVTPCTITMTIHKPIYPDEKGFVTKKLMADCFEAISTALPS